MLPAKMNPDLAMGDELLKKTGAGNLFMVFGEPNVEITKPFAGIRESPATVRPRCRGFPLARRSGNERQSSPTDWRTRPGAVEITRRLEDTSQGEELPNGDQGDG